MSQECRTALDPTRRELSAGTSTDHALTRICAPEQKGVNGSGAKALAAKTRGEHGSTMPYLRLLAGMSIHPPFFLELPYFPARPSILGTNPHRKLSANLPPCHKQGSETQNLSRRIDPGPVNPSGVYLPPGLSTTLSSHLFLASSSRA